LSDPDHLKTFSVDALYIHWLGRQKKGLSPFIVLNAGPLHSMASKKSKKDKGKGKQKYVEVSDDDDSGAEDLEERGSDIEDEVVDEEKGNSTEETESEADQGVKNRRAVKFGPPKKTPPPLANRGESPSQIAGPSNPKKGKHPKQSSKSIPTIGSQVCLKQNKSPTDADIIVNFSRQQRRRKTGKRRKVETRLMLS